jgi:NAD(P)-dependent dehydrogenase (short-subunit alcohol dehydrogenase family)
MQETDMSDVLVVTGASRGIGAAIARLGGRRRYAVCVNYHRSDAAAETIVAEIQNAGGKAIAVQADVGDPLQVDRLFIDVDERLGPVTALVNNAGMYAGANRVDEMLPEQLSRTFATNIFSYFFCARQAILRMSTKHGGRGGAIVNISSRGALFGGLPKEIHYAASKGAVDSFTKGLAREVGSEGIRVNGVRPGPILTDIHEVHGGEAAARAIGATGPLGRAGMPDEIAEVVMWLLSDASSYVHGAIIDATGGL